MTKLKICGLMSALDAAYANAVQPDFAGMILSPGFRRTVAPGTAQAIRETLDPAIPAVGVFVNAAAEEIAAYASCGIIQYVQLHGTEDAAYLRALRQICRLPVIQAFRIRTEADVRRAEQSGADFILLDSGTGSGKPFDWSLLCNVRRQFLLAGGITPENAGAVIAAYHPLGLDVSSGVETDGRKDPEKMEKIAAITKQQQFSLE